jgi:uncharacterized membrane protein
MQPNSPAHKNIQTICELEKAALADRSISARIGDAIATQAGKMWFIVIHVIWFTVWIVLNIGTVHTFTFDPFPFSLLTLVVSLEAIFLSLFILMSQNRTGVLAERRNHLDLQINLLSEDENTKMIQMLQALCAYHKLPIGADPEIRAMAQRTEVSEILKDLTDSLPAAEE